MGRLSGTTLRERLIAGDLTWQLIGATLWGDLMEAT